MNITDKRFLALLSLVLVAWAIIYQDAILGMEEIWSRSDTFAHGYFILPISLWLLWRDKENLIASRVNSTWLPLPILAGSLFVWLFSYAADINVLGQLSAVVSLICIIWLMVGNKIAWRYKFPLAYLLFSVPMGENLIPQLQDITAWFTVFFLKLNGIPVFVDGLYIQIPTGMFEVAVACSGIRYLIASIAVGTLFAYLTYTKTHKQIIFILFSIFLPILANGIRAYGIVVIAYYSDMKYATGVDHLIYGWLFFGLVIMLMFWIGGFFADPQKKQVSHATTKSKEPSYYPVTIVLIALVTSYLLVQQIQTVVKPEKATSALSGNSVEHSNWGITFNDALQRSHININKQIELFRAVYAHKQDVGELVSFDNKYYDHKRWTIIKEKVVIIDGLSAKYLLLRNILGGERVVLYWYKIEDEVLINKAKIKLLQALTMFISPNSKGEFLAISIPNGNENEAITAAESFLKALPRLSSSSEQNKNDR